MKQAIVVDANDVKEILAKHFGVASDAVIKSQYSYTVIMEKEGGKVEKTTTGEVDR